jgi:hypothetical protein
MKRVLAVLLIVLAASRPAVDPTSSHAAAILAESGPAQSGAVSPGLRAALRTVVVSDSQIHSDTASVAFSGYAGWASSSLGSRYLAMRLPRGTRVRLCGPAACWTTRTTDFGPSSLIRPPRVADVAVGQWERIAGLGRRYGLTWVRVIVLDDGPGPTAPPTDVTP